MEELKNMTVNDLKKHLAEPETETIVPDLKLKEKPDIEDEEENKRERMRVEVLNEILISEKYYVRDLEIILNLFLIPIRTNQIVKEEDIKSLFSNIELIYTVNHEVSANFQNELERVQDMQLINMGLLFIKTVEFLKVYSIYSTNYANAIATYERLKKENKDFVLFLQEAEAKPDVKGINLMGYLIKPVQKICKYPLLFKELLKNTPSQHPDYENISLCLKRVEEVAEYVNERKRASENMHKMLDISEHLTDVPKSFEFFTPARTFIREGMVGKINESGKLQERYFFLFNDGIVYTKTQLFKKTTYSYKGFIPLDCCLLNDLVDTDEYQNAFSLIRIDSKKKNIICCNNVADKASWMEDISKIIDDFLEKAKKRSSFISQSRSSLDNLEKKDS